MGEGKCFGDVFLIHLDLIYWFSPHDHAHYSKIIMVKRVEGLLLAMSVDS